MIIFEDENYKLIKYSPLFIKGRYILVTFSDMIFTQKSENDFWGEAIAEYLGVVALGVVAKKADFYPNNLFANCLRKIKEFTENNEVWLYGSSMGAGGAMRYASALSAKYVFAFSPIISIDPSICLKNDERYISHHSDGNIYQFDECLIDDNSIKAFIFYDSYCREDKWQLSLNRIKGSEIFDLMYCGHATVHIFSGRMNIDNLFKKCISKSVDKFFLKKSKRNSPLYYQGIATLLRSRKKSKLGLKIIQSSIDNGVFNADSFYVKSKFYRYDDLEKVNSLALSLFLFGKKSPARVVKAFQISVEKASNYYVMHNFSLSFLIFLSDFFDNEFILKLSRFFYKEKDFSRSLALAQKICSSDLVNSNYLNHYGCLLIEKGELSLAKEIFQKSLERSRDSHIAWKKLCDIFILNKDYKSLSLLLLDVRFDKFRDSNCKYLIDKIKI